MPVTTLTGCEQSANAARKTVCRRSPAFERRPNLSNGGCSPIKLASVRTRQITNYARAALRPRVHCTRLQGDECRFASTMLQPVFRKRQHQLLLDRVCVRTGLPDRGEISPIGLLFALACSAARSRFTNFRTPLELARIQAMYFLRCFFLTSPR